VTHAVYRSGTIGRAKEHLEATARQLTDLLRGCCGGEARVSINKAVVTQASAAIPAVALYMSILLRVMKANGTNEVPVEQMVRLFRDHFGPGATPNADEEGRIRLDDLEMRPQVQAEVAALWERVSTENLAEVSDYAGYRRDFRRLFGFEVEGIDYDAPTEVHRELV
jgi:enoyl-[acyl-carrier protein] reductase/trans-2-enoyl-CoA reductase (NAD+)